MKTIYDYARKRAGIYPDKVAISFGNEHLTYWELETRSNQLAELLINIGLKPGDRVGLLLSKSPKAIIAMHGINKAGGVYVPLDIDSPAERLIKILLSADPGLLMVDLPGFNSLSDIRKQIGTSDLTLAWWDYDQPSEMDHYNFSFTLDDIHNAPDFPHSVVHDPNAPAHILFTSGSTGTPKGVVITHKNVTSFIDWAKINFEMNEDDRVSCHSPLHFDLSTFDIYGGLAAGGRIFLVPQEININPKKLISFVADNRLTQWFSVPSALSYLANFDIVPTRGFPFLKRLLWCGEVFPIKSLRYWMKKLPHVQFTNLYGPTEATIASSYHRVFQIPGEKDEVPIGRPCAGEKLWVLDSNLKELPVGETGDLYISGLGLSPGYWRNEKKTKEAFIDWQTPEGEAVRLYKTGDLASLRRDLNYYYHGRSDYQIKSRGYRIELGEVEQAIDELGILHEFAVVPVQRGGFEGTSIGCAFVSKTEEGPVSPIALKKELEKKIPSYMIPQLWQHYEILPRNGNGKIDRKSISDNFLDHVSVKKDQKQHLVSHQDWNQ